MENYQNNLNALVFYQLPLFRIETLISNSLLIINELISIRICEIIINNNAIIHLTVFLLLH